MIEVNDDGTTTTPEDRAAIERFRAEPLTPETEAGRALVIEYGYSNQSYRRALELVLAIEREARERRERVDPEPAHDWCVRCCPSCGGCPSDRERRERVDPDLLRENERLRAAVIEGDRRIEALRERIHPTIDGYCPKCGGGCLIVFAAATPARDAVQP